MCPVTERRQIVSCGVMRKTADVIDLIGYRLGHYGQWRNRLMLAIQEYQKWYERQTDEDATYELRLHELIESLRTDKLTLAVVGEFSRGKTELINALFFADYNRRLLPSTPGRTTMCPTEIRYDDHLDPCVRLLPIETRKSALTINEHKKNAVNWTKLPLNLDSADEMAETLLNTMSTKSIPNRQARELGLYRDDIVGQTVPIDGNIEIPVWRHAIINYPHPLLKQGLAILDTPGLNALGSEPELTLNMLPEAHAILFVLAADTGVTKTDLQVWRNHVCIATRNSRSRLVSLNKIDTFWDDLLSDAEVKNYVNKQMEETERLLDVQKNSIFAVSAQKGLVGKIKKDNALIERSGLKELEEKLSKDIVAYKQQFLRDKVVNNIGTVVESSRHELNALVTDKRRELHEIRELRGKSEDIVGENIKQIKKQQKAFQKQVQNFMVTRKLLTEQLRHMMGRLSMKRFDALLIDTRDSMRGSWTTQGLRRSISRFFAETKFTLTLVERESDNICNMVDKIYDRFHTECGLPKARPVKFTVSPFIRQFQRLHQDAEAFRDSPTMVMLEQHFVIKRFFMSMAVSARTIFTDCRTAARNWGKAVLRPIKRLIEEHQKTIIRRMENLEKLQHSHESLEARLAETAAQLQELMDSVVLIEKILDMIYNEDETLQQLPSGTNPACG